MNLIHKDLTQERWFKFSIFEQMANIGSEIFRAISRRNQNNDYSRKAFERSLELFDLTAEDPKNKNRLKEILLAREMWCDFIVGDNQYKQTDKMWQDYFYSFNWAARLGRQ